jgi:hypothetical protein
VKTVICVALIQTIGIRLVRCIADKNHVTLTGKAVSQVKIVTIVAVEEPTMVMVQYVVVNAYRVGRSAAISVLVTNVVLTMDTWVSRFHYCLATAQTTQLKYP